MAKFKRLDPAQRKQDIVTHALALAKQLGYTALTQRNVATAANCSPGLVINYFKTVQGLRTAVMLRAVEDEVEEVVAQGLVSKHEVALNAPQELRQRSIINAYS